MIANRSETACAKCSCMSALATGCTQRRQLLIFLLLGGDKSTQRRDVKRAKAIAQLIED